MSLNPSQFVAYRGLLVDTGRAPEDDQAILDRLHPAGRDGTAYGQHWSRSHEVAKRFATTANAGGYERLPAQMRRFTGPDAGDRWGVVLEGRVVGRGGDQSIPYSEHEQEVGVHRVDDGHPAINLLQSVTAHVYDLKSRETLAQEHPVIPGQTGALRRRSEAFHEAYKTPIRSFEIPESHWKG